MTDIQDIADMMDDDDEFGELLVPSQLAHLAYTIDDTRDKPINKRISDLHTYIEMHNLTDEVQLPSPYGGGTILEVTIISMFTDVAKDELAFSHSSTVRQAHSDYHLRAGTNPNESGMSDGQHREMYKNAKSAIAVQYDKLRKIVHDLLRKEHMDELSVVADKYFDSLIGRDEE